MYKWTIDLNGISTIKGYAICFESPEAKLVVPLEKVFYETKQIAEKEMRRLLGERKRSTDKSRRLRACVKKVEVYIILSGTEIGYART